MKLKTFRSVVLAGLTAWGTACAVPAMGDDAATTQAAASQPTSQPSVAVDQLTPRGTLKVLETASISGDAATLRTLFATHNDLEKQVVNAWADNAAARTALGMAEIKKFAPPNIDIAARRAAKLAESMSNIDSLVETVNGDDAGVGPAGRPPVAKLTRVDGKWLVPFSAAFGDNSDLHMRIEAFGIESGVLNELTQGIENGLFKSPDEVQAAYQQRMTEAAKATTQPSTQQSGEPTTKP